MRSYMRIHSPWSQLALFIMLLGGAFIVTYMIAAAVLFSKGLVLARMSDINLNDTRMLDALKLIQAISTITIFFIPAVAFAFIAFRFRSFHYLGLSDQARPVFYLIAIVIVFCSFPLVAWLGEINQHMRLSKWMVESEKDANRQMEAFLKVRSTSDIIVNVLLIALLPAICEEVFFRGALQRILIDIFKSPWTGILLSAALFSAFHMQFEGFIPRMFLGVLLGSLFWYSNSLWPNIVAHFFYNAIQVLAVVYDPKLIDRDPTVPLYAAIVSAVIVLALLLFMKYSSKMSYAKAYEQERISQEGDSRG